ncbi:MAG: leucyl/phenylalanyl-tRNA--protein transferase [Bacteroidia bacterium]|nr:leucyl/phenylalanyl-tRNA--protein transferase [Bacteroidia bacterium]
MFYLFNSNFPDPNLADEEGLVAVGADLEPETLIKAYSMGLFPWYSDDDPIMWWSPDPRLILIPKEVVISKSMKQLFKKQVFQFTVNKAFEQVIFECRNNRLLKEGTWITPEIQQAYQALHKLGYAHSVEVWNNEVLVGGLYGVMIGKVFFGESMFSKESNASKAALIYWCLHCLKHDIRLIDCQQSTNHLKSMGAYEIPRNEFLSLLEILCVKQV